MDCRTWSSVTALHAPTTRVDERLARVLRLAIPPHRRRVGRPRGRKTKKPRAQPPAVASTDDSNCVGDVGDDSSVVDDYSGWGDLAPEPPPLVDVMDPIYGDLVHAWDANTGWFLYE